MKNILHVFFLFFVPLCFLHAQNIGVNATGAAPDKSAIVDINASPNYNQGLLVPRMTTTQRNNLATSCSCTPAQSLLIFNITDSCFETYLGTTWHSIWCTNSPCVAPVAPTAGTNTPSTSQVVWNWNTSTGATVYYYNTVNTFSTAISNGASTTYTQTGLTCGTTDSLYVWADNSCGHSPVTGMAQATSACVPTCGSQVWAAANLTLTPLTTYTVTQATTQAASQEWCYNDVPANCTTYGGLFVWSSAMNLPNADNSAYANGMNLPSCNPCTGAAATAIQGACPSGYHVPTDLEWSQYEYCLESTITPTGATSLTAFQTGTAWRGSTVATAGVYQGPGAKMKETTAQGGTWADGAYSNNLSGFSALPAGFSYSGSSSSLGSDVYFWSSTEASPTDGWGRGLTTGVSQSYRINFYKPYGYSVRCLQN